MVITINNLFKEYPVVLKKNSLNNLKDYFNVKTKSIVITDDLVPNVHVQNVLVQLDNAYLYVIKHGEKNKTLSTVNSILEFMLEKGFDRYSQVIALGGGLVGDLSGFVSSIYNRGIKFINIPTTTLSMIDSSVGGKVGVNLNETKNVIGSFYNPEVVIIDTNVLTTLPKRHYHNGLVEALKMGLCLDKDLYNLFKQDIDSNLEDIIKLAILAKKKVVELDPKEENLRKVLNFGHTIGHAIESSNFNDFYHGEAVAYGMIYFIEDNTLKDEIKTILNKMNINLLKDINLNNLFNHLIHDKKKENDLITIVKLISLEKFEFVKYRIDDIFQIVMEVHHE